MYHVLENTFVCVDRFQREKKLVVVINYHLARKLLIDLCLTIEANMPGCTHGFDPKILHCIFIVFRPGTREIHENPSKL